MVCMGCAHPVKFVATIQSGLGLPSEAAAAEAIRAWAAYPAAGATLDLVAQLTGQAKEASCTFFRSEDR